MWGDSGRTDSSENLYDSFERSDDNPILLVVVIVIVAIVK